MSGRATPMIDVSMITRNCATAMTQSAFQRRGSGVVDCIVGLLLRCGGSAAKRGAERRAQRGDLGDRRADVGVLNRLKLVQEVRDVVVVVCEAGQGRQGALLLQTLQLLPQ